MDAMYSAIKSRRGGLLNDQEENAHQMPVDQAPKPKADGLQTLVETLSDDQKTQLLSLLVKDQGAQASSEGKSSPVDAKQIEKGGMGPGEQQEVDEMIDNDLGDGHESEDQIANSMISSSDQMRSARGDSPRNLGERMKFDLAKKLKNKGN